MIVVGTFKGKTTPVEVVAAIVTAIEVKKTMNTSSIE